MVVRLGPRGTRPCSRPRLYRLAHPATSRLCRARLSRSAKTLTAETPKANVSGSSVSQSCTCGRTGHSEASRILVEAQSLTLNIPPSDIYWSSEHKPNPHVTYYHRFQRHATRS